MSKSSQKLCKQESSNVVYICRMSDGIVGLRLRLMALILLFLSIFLSFPILHVNIKNLVRVFSGTLLTRILKHDLHMDNELLYCGIENRTYCSYSCLYLSIFVSFKAKFVSRFSQELFKFESSIMECICKMSDHIVGLRNELIALFLLFFIHFSLFPISHVSIENLASFHGKC